MDLLGESLHDVLKKHDRAIEPTQIINYAKQMIELVRQIHKISFIYRDIKPENFVFTDHTKQ
jgi:serine/threonine protein kinase